MKKIKRLFWVILLSYQSVLAQSGPFNLAAIPDEVKNKAAVIVHLDDERLEIENLEKASLTVHRISTVMNESGKGELFFRQYTSKYVSLDDPEIKVYDANGKQISKYKKKDMITQATGEGLIEDGYVTYCSIVAPSYPVTVELKYELKFKSTLIIPDFRFINPREGVIESNFTAIVPVNIPLRYKPEHNAIQPEVSQLGANKIYKWSVKNLSPIEYEEGSTSGANKYPHIKLVSDKFSHYGFPGDFSSWKSFGTWIKDLYKGLDVLPPDRQEFFKTLVQKAGSEKEKIKMIYTYLQQNFRYVSIQLGIGGLRPFSADFTDKKKYGDCKALSNYMKAALSCVGIRSHVAIINAEYDQEPVDPSFPVNDFNHVILCVPHAKDSIWLECTSSTAGFGELGTFTENRNALLITEDGGVLVATPASVASSNLLSTVTRVTIREDQSAMTDISFNVKGSYREALNSILKEKNDEQKESLVSYLGFKQPDEFLWSKDQTSQGDVIKLKMVNSKLPEFSAGDKFFISQRMNKLWVKRMPKADSRKLDYYFRYPFEKTDTTIYQLYEGMKPDVLPAEKKISCAYASYQSKCWYNDKENSVYSTSTLVLKKHRIPAADYAQVKTFFENVTQDDTQKIVVQKGAAGPAKKAF